jgi:hypothetical protein
LGDVVEQGLPFYAAQLPHFTQLSYPALPRYAFDAFYAFVRMFSFVVFLYVCPRFDREIVPRPEFRVRY